jgi:hypothetical protein
MHRLRLISYILGKTDEGNAVVTHTVDLPFVPTAGMVLMLPGPLNEDGEPSLLEYPLDQPTYHVFYGYFEDRQNESSARDIFLTGDIEAAIAESQRLLEVYKAFGFEDVTPVVEPLETDGELE